MKLLSAVPPRLLGLQTRGVSSAFASQVDDLARRAALGEFRRGEESAGERPGSRMAVLLLHPPGACSAFTRSGSQYPPLGLNQLKAVIGSTSLVDVLEADGFGYSVEETADHMRRVVPAAVGMTVTCGTKPLVHAWSTVAKNLSAVHQPIVIVGGPAAAFESQAIFEDCPNVDVVVKGEGEVTFPSVVDILRIGASAGHAAMHTLSELSKLPGVCVRNMPALNDSKIPILPKEAFDSLPFPDLSASPVSMYRAPDAMRSPMITMMTQRGCIAQCAFCNTPQIHGRKIRGWSNEHVVEELLELKRRHGIREVSFVDDVFTNRPGGGVRRLCELMIREGLDLTWYCNVRADQITPRIAAAMRSAGCHQVFMGFESGCDQMLKRINKGERVADLERGASILKDAGIKISIGFIVGLPGETDESVRKSIELCNKVQPYRVQFTRFTPIPGSQLASHAHTQVQILDSDVVAKTAVVSKGFHDRSSKDQVEAWLKMCYEACQYMPSI